MTSWVRSGVPCICVDQEWHDLFSQDEVAGPLLGERYVVAESSVIDGALFIKVMGDAYFYEAAAFRPAIDAADDVALFRQLLTDSSAPIRTSESACSS